MLFDGLYEEILTRALKAQLEKTNRSVELSTIEEKELAEVLARHIGRNAKKGLEEVGRRLHAAGQIEFTNRLVAQIADQTKKESVDGSVCIPPRMLSALISEDGVMHERMQNGEMPRPLTPIGRTCVFTGSTDEPQLYAELKREILSADRVDLLISFIRWSGLRLLMRELRRFTDTGGQLRVVTTTYMGATDFKAVEELSALPGTDIKISYDSGRTRLHAKSYIFHRNTGFSTAYVGSSNLSGAAVTTGLEWNLKLAEHDQPGIVQRIESAFETCWNSPDFETYSPEDEMRLRSALEEGQTRHHLVTGSPEVMRPYPFQEEVLEALAAERAIHGRYRNLIVAATGTGKTVIAALDYRRFCTENAPKPSRLLFIAHREEILRQSLQTFRTIMDDPHFGELCVGGLYPPSLDHVFMSIQTFGSRDLAAQLPPDHYDYIVVDEFHHAAAASYRKLLSHFHPRVLLGLTATPERMDGKSILSFFDGHVAAEIRLPDAIDRGLLCPFQYFGVDDDVDLSALTWTRGGYDRDELSDLYTFSGAVARKRAGSIVRSVRRYVADIKKVRGLGFCVSVAHAQFMAQFFLDQGIPSIALSGASTEEERIHARHRLVSGEIQFIFVVDLYNEGVDIPEVDTVMFLRPTESLTVFLQQLGRGLRLSPGKECLTVLDFIGQANRNYDFEKKLRALLPNGARSLVHEIQADFPFVPRGCFVELEPKSQRIILENIRSFCTTRASLAARIRQMDSEAAQPPTLSGFLDHTGLDPARIYRFSSFSRLCVQAGAREPFNEPFETGAAKAFLRLSSLDSRRLLSFLESILPAVGELDADRLSPLEKRMFQMFYITVWGTAALDWEAPEVRKNLKQLAESPILLAELLDLLHWRRSKIDFLDSPCDLGFACPLDIHCTYSRDQLFVALDYMTPSNIREGVKWLPEKKIDVLLITVRKSEKEYSATTMYEDYAMGSDLFHWQSQSNTSVSSSTGQRYIHHAEEGSRVLLFVREYKQSRLTGLAEGYTFLGPAACVGHEGSRPMNIIWKLEHPIPPRFLQESENRMAAM